MVLCVSNSEPQRIDLNFSFCLILNPTIFCVYHSSTPADLTFNGFYRKMINLLEIMYQEKDNTKTTEKRIINLGLQKKSRQKVWKRQAINEKLAYILSKIFNLSINKGKFIYVLKIVKVVPVFKNKGITAETGNYMTIYLSYQMSTKFMRK